MSRQRLFIAADFNDEIVQGCARVIEELQRHASGAKVRWADPRQLHLTLKFLGSTASEDVPILHGLLKTIAPEFLPLEVSLEGVGCFPEKGAPQVIWVGVREQTEQLAEMAQVIDSELAQFGFAQEARAFVPHLTLGRIKEGKFPRGAFKDFESLRIGTAVISEIVLYESKTLPEGAVYAPLSRFR